MKHILLIFSFLVAYSSAFAGHFACQSRDRQLNFLMKQRTSNLYAFYECDARLVNCTSAVVFQALGYEQEGSFSLHGKRTNGQRMSLALVKAKDGWTGTVTDAAGKRLQALLECEPYRP